MFDLSQNIFLSIASCIREKRNFEINNLRLPLINGQLNWRILNLKINSIEEYYDYLFNSENEIDELINAFLVNYSKFFRNPLLYEYITSVLLPRTIAQKSNERTKNLEGDKDK